MRKIEKSNLSFRRRLIRWSLILACCLAFPLIGQAAKVLFVQNGFLPSAVKMISILRAQGHDVTVWTIATDGNTSSAATYASQGYQLIIVDEVVGSGNVGASMRGSPIPVINWEGFLYNGNRSAFNADAGLTGGTYADGATALAENGGLGADFGQVGNETNILITAPSHPLAAGLGAGLVAVFDPAGPGDLDGAGVISFAGNRTFTPNVQVVATVPNFSPGMSLWGIPAGVLLADGTTSQARWVHLPWNTTSPQRRLIEPSYFLFEAAVAWALTNAQPVKIFNLTPEGGSFLPTNTIVSCAVNKTNNAGSAVASGNIVVKVNGTTVSSGVSISDGGAVWNVSYTNGFALNARVTVAFSATSADGGLGARQSSFDTFSTNNFTWEAEDFNFDGGGFFDNIVLCDTIGGGTPGCYFDRVGFTNIDKSEINFVVTTVPQTNEVYRFGPQLTVRDEWVDTFLTTDPMIRSQYTTAGLPDYEVRNIVANEWLNYTRTFPAGTYNIYARVISGTALTIQLDAVDDGSNTVQNLTKIGRFVKPAGTSGYEFVPLTDDSGLTPIVVELTGSSPRTFRTTALSAGYTPNFFMLVPTAAPVNEPPTVNISSPTNGATLSAGVPSTIIANPVDTDGTITNVQFFAGRFGQALSLIGEANSAPWEAQFTPVNHGPMSFQTIQVVAKDNGGLQASAELDVRVIDPGVTIVSTAVGNGADAEMREHQNLGVTSGGNGDMNTRTSVNGDRNELIALRFDLTGYDLSQLQNVKLHVVEFRNNGARELAVYGVAQGTAGAEGSFTTEDWTEAGLITFGTLPGLLATDGNFLTQSLNTGSLTTLVTNQPYTGAKADVNAFATPELQAFVNNYTGSSLITFIMAAAPTYTSTGQGRIAAKEAFDLDGDRPAGALGDYAPFLSFTVGSTQPQLMWNQVGNSIQFSWSGAFKLQAQTNNLSGGLGSSAWGDYPGGGTSPVSVPVDASQGAVFFRLAPTP